MFIETETTPNPATLKFLPGELVMQTGTREFRDEVEAAASPLASALFDLGDVTGVFFGRDFVSVTAAPGVDHATITGLRKISDGTSEHSPMPKPNAHIQDVICAGVAPNACAAWNTMATELVNPTKTATKPATNVDRLRSLKNCMGEFWHQASCGHSKR